MTQQPNSSVSFSNPVHRLRIIALIEGASFLFLLFIAMPLKYVADMPMAVKYTGWAHGLLFIALCLAIVDVMMNVDKWPFKNSVIVFIAALLPFGPFVIDRRLKNAE